MLFHVKAYPTGTVQPSLYYKYIHCTCNVHEFTWTSWSFTSHTTCTCCGAHILHTGVHNHRRSVQPSMLHVITSNDICAWVA